MRKIADSHVHIRFTRDEDIARMLDDIASVGVTAVNILSLSYRGVAEDLAALWQKMTRKDLDIRAFGGLHVNDRYMNVPPEVQVEKLLDLGCDGFKIMYAPALRRFMPEGLDSAKYSKMFSLLEERGIPTTIHVADPEDFWDEGRQYGDKSFPSKKQLYDEIFRVLDAHPRLRVSFPHFFFLSNFPDEAERVMETYPNVRFDLTPGVEMYYNFDSNIDVWHDFFTKYSDRILFGTDSNTVKSNNFELVELVRRKLCESREIFSQHCYGKDFIVRGLYLDEDTVDKICYRNFFDYDGEKKKVDENKFYEYCEIMKKSIEADPTEPIVIPGEELNLGGKTENSIALEFLDKRLAGR